MSSLKHRLESLYRLACLSEKEAAAFRAGTLDSARHEEARTAAFVLLHTARTRGVKVRFEVKAEPPKPDSKADALRDALHRRGINIDPDGSVPFRTSSTADFFERFRKEAERREAEQQRQKDADMNAFRAERERERNAEQRRTRGAHDPIYNWMGRNADRANPFGPHPIGTDYATAQEAWRAGAISDEELRRCVRERFGTFDATQPRTYEGRPGRPAGHGEPYQTIDPDKQEQLHAMLTLIARGLRGEELDERLRERGLKETYDRWMAMVR